MENGQWYLRFWINVTGETSLGGEVDLDREIIIPLYAENMEDAGKQAEIIIKEIKKAANRIDRRFFMRYTESIDDEDGLSFSNFRLTFEADLEIDIPKIIGGP